jgi:transcriptional regulator GlxA family with amidase domain
MLTPEECARARAGAGDARLERLEDFIEANLTEPMTRETLASVVGVSLRTINRDFRARHGLGVMAFVRRRRLEAARRALLDAEPGSARIQDIALRFGFTEFGKFSAGYRRAFGELPSRTLHR